MFPRSLGWAGLLAVMAGMSGYAQAVTCYQIVDASDRTVYRASVPPFSLAGSEWNAAQTQLRARGQLLMWFDTNNCPQDTPNSANRDAASILSSRDTGTSQGVFADSASPGTGMTGGGQTYIGPRGGRVLVPVGRGN